MSLKTQAKQVVDRYGLHRDEANDMWWLLQASRTANAIGLPDKYCPFRIKTHLMMCSHDINLSTVVPESDPHLIGYEKVLKKSQLLPHFDLATAHALDPRIIYVEVESVKDYHTLVRLQSMANPNISISTSADLIKSNLEIVNRRLNASNLASYLIYGFGTETTTLVEKLLSACLIIRGKLIMAGPKLPLFNMADTCERIPFEPVLTDLVNKTGDQKLKEIGAVRLKKFMRGQ